MRPQLHEIDLNITDRCNLNCQYCSVFVTPVNDTSKELSLEEIIDLFDQFEELGVGHVRLAGGEPLVRRDIEDIVIAAGERSFSTTILTNGTPLTKSLVDLIKSRPAKIDLAFSIDGVTAARHNASRGCNSAFGRIVAMADYCSEISLDHTMMTVVTAEVTGQMNELVSFAGEHGFNRVNFILLGYVGKAKESDASFPNYGDWSRAIVGLTRFLGSKQDLPNVSILFPHEDEVPYELYEPLKKASMLDALEDVWGIKWQLQEAAGQIGKSRCMAGYNGLTILPNGEVYGCDLMRHNREFRAGNIHDTSIGDIFNNSPLLNGLRQATQVFGCARFEDDSKTFSCGQCRAGVASLQEETARRSVV